MTNHEEALAWSTEMGLLPAALQAFANDVRGCAPRPDTAPTGPFRFISHPNYLIVAAEITFLPLAFGLPLFAAVFSAVNAVVLAAGIPCESAALAAGLASKRNSQVSE